MNKVDAECDACSGTGLYHGFMERDGEFVICIGCGGTGKKTLVYTPFTTRGERKGVDRIRSGSGTILDNPRAATWISYSEFKKLIPG